MKRRIWRLWDHSDDHCPGGCYFFKPEVFPEDGPNDGLPGTLHVPLDMFWGKQPWQWSTRMYST